jgi:catechol 2,3-dioxygenase-like lactoylglutathione lyase family enzyme
VIPGTVRLISGLKASARCLAAAVAGVAAAWVCAALNAAPAVHVGLSHVPIAVADLEQAAADYSRLGFALKEGRLHPNGIRNRHVKFPDGTELELITAPAATDALTRYYRTVIAAGDGPAFLSLDAHPADVAARQVTAAGLPAHVSGGYVDFPYESALGYVFFAGLNQSPTDRPEHFAHRNGAQRLIGVTLAGSDLTPERRLFRALGVTEVPCGRGAGAGVTCVVLHDGSRIRLESTAGGARAAIVELELRIADPSRLIAVLDAGHVQFVTDPSRSRISINGGITHGITLTFATVESHDSR